MPTCFTQTLPPPIHPSTRHTLTAHPPPSPPTDEEDEEEKKPKTKKVTETVTEWKALNDNQVGIQRPGSWAESRPARHMPHHETPPQQAGRQRMLATAQAVQALAASCRTCQIPPTPPTQK